jgi:hypothetical protein
VGFLTNMLHLITVGCLIDLYGSRSGQFLDFPSQVPDHYDNFIIFSQLGFAATLNTCSTAMILLKSLLGRALGATGT